MPITIKVHTCPTGTDSLNKFWVWFLYYKIINWNCLSNLYKMTEHSSLWLKLQYAKWKKTIVTRNSQFSEYKSLHTPYVTTITYYTNRDVLTIQISKYLLLVYILCFFFVKCTPFKSVLLKNFESHNIYKTVLHAYSVLFTCCIKF